MQESKMGRTLVRTLENLGFVLVLTAVAFSSGCSKQASLAVPPYLPPEYYSCYEARGSDLSVSYFSNYGNLSRSETLYNDHYFVFKDQLVEKWTIKELDQGWIWLEGNIKCELLNKDNMKYFKVGQKIDVVGYNAGVISHSVQGLLFTKCIVLAAGTIQLPAAGSNSAPSVY
jgi:hypothetical protein